MIFKPKISHQKPIKPPLKADFNAYFTQKRMIFTPIYKICATPKGPFRVRFPAGVPNKKEPSGSFLFGVRCGSEPVVRPIAQQWHEERSDEVFPAATSFKKALGLFFVWLSVRKRTRGSSHCAAMARAQNNVRQTACADLREVFPAGVPRRRKAAMSAASSLAAWPKGLRLLFPHICCASVREPYFSRAYGLFFVWLSMRKRTLGSPHCAAMAQKAKRRQFSMRRGMFKPRRGWRRWAPFSPPSRRERRSPQRR